MKKNLILMTALFTGSMLLNNGFGGNNQLTEDTYDTIRNEFFNGSVYRDATTMYYPAETIHSIDEYYDWFYTFFDRISKGLTQIFPIIQYEYNTQEDNKQESFDYFRNITKIFYTAKNHPSFKNNIKKFPKQKDLRRKIKECEEYISKIQKMEDTVDSNIFSDTEEYDKYWRDDSKFHDELLQRKAHDELLQKKAEEAEEAKARLKKCIKYGLTAVATAATAGVAYYLYQQYPPAVMASFTAVSYTISAIYGQNVTVSQSTHWGTQHSEVEFKCADYKTARSFRDQLQEMYPDIMSTDNDKYKETINKFIENCPCAGKLGYFRKGCIDGQSKMIKK